MMEGEKIHWGKEKVGETIEWTLSIMGMAWGKGMKMDFEQQLQKPEKINWQKLQEVSAP